MTGISYSSGKKIYSSFRSNLLEGKKMKTNDDDQTNVEATYAPIT